MSTAAFQIVCLVVRAAIELAGRAGSCGGGAALVAADADAVTAIIGVFATLETFWTVAVGFAGTAVLRQNLGILDTAEVIATILGVGIAIVGGRGGAALCVLLCGDLWCAGVGVRAIRARGWLLCGVWTCRWF